MAYLFRPATVKPIPVGAERLTIRGKACVRWVARGGKVATAEVTGDGTRCRVRGPVWWVGYRDAAGVRRKVKGFRDRAATLELAVKLAQQTDNVRAGREDVSTECVHLVDHLPAYRDHVVRKCRNTRHVYEAVEYVRQILTGAGITTAAAVDCERLAGWLDRERERIGAGKRKWSQRTLNHRVAKLKAFGNWLVPRRAKYNPFAGLRGSSVESDRRRIRRALEHVELLRLIHTARSANTVYQGLDGPARAALYTVAAFTGLRISSLGRLTPESVEWVDGVPSLVYSRRNKNGKPVGIPLHPEVGRVLADWLAARPAGQPLWSGVKTWCQWGAKMLRADLAASGIPYRDAAGEYFDFHSLRVQFGSSLARAGVPLSAAQELLDHSDPRLTANIYTRWGRGELAGEVAKLPGLEPPG